MSLLVVSSGIFFDVVLLNFRHLVIYTFSKYFHRFLRYLEII